MGLKFQIFGYKNMNETIIIIGQLAIRVIKTINNTNNSTRRPRESLPLSIPSILSSSLGRKSVKCASLRRHLVQSVVSPTRSLSLKLLWNNLFNNYRNVGIDVLV